MWRLCTKNTSRALIERPYSCVPQAVGAVYDRPGFFVESPIWRTTAPPDGMSHVLFIPSCRRMFACNEIEIRTTSPFATTLCAEGNAFWLTDPTDHASCRRSNT